MCGRGENGLVSTVYTFSYSHDFNSFELHCEMLSLFSISHTELVDVHGGQLSSNRLNVNVNHWEM